MNLNKKLSDIQVQEI